MLQGAAIFRRWWTRLPLTRAGSLLNLGVRLVLLPIFLAVEALMLPWRIAAVEPSDYQIQKGKQSSVEGPRSVLVFKDRISACWRASFALLLQAVTYMVVLDVVAVLGLEHVVRNFRAEIERTLAWWFGLYYQTEDGQCHPLSPVSSNVDFNVRWNSQCIEHQRDLCPCVGGLEKLLKDCPCRASLMAACCTLSYEVEPVIQDVLTTRWGLKFVAYNNIPANLHENATYVPDLVSFVAATSSSLIVAFTGAQFSYKIDRGTDIPTAMSEYPDCGRMTDGMVRGLEQPTATGSSVFTELQELLSQQSVHRGAIYLTGHSLGGALAIAFAQLLSVRKPQLAKKIAGIFTFGAPRLGDRVFVNLLEQRFAGRLFRYVNASDMVCQLPHQSQGIVYHHHANERFIASFAPKGRAHRILTEEDDPKLLAELRLREQRCAHFYNLAKLFSPQTQGRGCGYAVRLLMLLLPGLADHFPSEYQDALEEVLSVSAKGTLCKVQITNAALAHPFTGPLKARLAPDRKVAISCS